jgi:transposase InsO family protein
MTREIGTDVAAAIAAMQIHDLVTAPRSPWQNAYVERFIGSIRRECLDHVIVLNAAGLRQVLTEYVAYYTGSRTMSVWRRTLSSVEPSCRRAPVGLSRWHRSTDSTIATTCGRVVSICCPA